MEEDARAITATAAEKARAVAAQKTVRALARDWISGLKEVWGAKPSTVKDYGFLLREPGQPYKRGNKTTAGRIMKAFGDSPAAEVTTAEVSRFLRSLDGEGLTPRNVNKHREVLAAMFAYGCRDDALALPANPVDGTDKRRQPPPAALDYYEVEEVEALARACERGEHRLSRSLVDEAELKARRREDHQDAEAFRLLFYTGVRLGEVLTLRWEDVDVDRRMLFVRHGLSGGEERLPKGGRARFVPLSTPALGALQRLRAREEFTGTSDYVLANRLGRRLDASALRRRYKRAAQQPDFGRSASTGCGMPPGVLLRAHPTPCSFGISSATPSCPRPTATSVPKLVPKNWNASTGLSPRLIGPLPSHRARLRNLDQDLQQEVTGSIPVPPTQAVPAYGRFWTQPCFVHTEFLARWSSDLVVKRQLG